MPKGAIAGMLKEAGLTTAIAAALALPLIGLKTVIRGTGLEVETRLFEFFLALVLIFLGRLALVLNRRDMPRPALIGGAVVAVIGAVLTGFGDLIGALNGVLQPLCLAAGAKAAACASLVPKPGVFISAVCLMGGSIVALRAAFVIWGGGPAMTREVARHVLPWLGPGLIAVAVVLPMVPFVDRRIVDIGILVLIYVMLGWGLNIVVGLAGLLDLGYVAFYAVGAYSFALIAVNFDYSFWVCLPLAGLFAAFFGLVLGFPVLRLRGDYLAIVTLGFGEMVRIILLNWYKFTNGPDGITSIPRPTFFGLPFTRNPPAGVESFSEFFGMAYSPLHRIVFLYYVVLVLALITNGFALSIRKLPLGRAWEALREDEIACRSLGINPTNTKLSAFAIGAMFGGFAGALFATRQGFISPESFTFIESAIILSIVVLGGMGSQVGVVIAAILLIGVPEAFRGLQEYRMLAFGAAMVLIMTWRPRGLLAHREPTLRLAGRSEAPP
jgi:branched-chain amino acid transport system permease protein